MPKLLFSLFISTSFSYSQCLEMYETHQSGGGIDVPEYVYGEDNCCDEFPISFCNEKHSFETVSYTHLRAHET